MTFKILDPSADIFSSTAEVLVDPVDAQTGAQGRGLASGNATGMTSQRLGSVSRTQYVFFAATKDHWRELSQVQFVADAVQNVVKHAIALRVRSVAVPALGCGLGGLSWDEVLPAVRLPLAWLGSTRGVDVFLYPPRR